MTICEDLECACDYHACGDVRRVNCEFSIWERGWHWGLWNWN